MKKLIALMFCMMITASVMAEEQVLIAIKQDGSWSWIALWRKHISDGVVERLLPDGNMDHLRTQVMSLPEKDRYKEVKTLINKFLRNKEGFDCIPKVSKKGFQDIRGVKVPNENAQTIAEQLKLWGIQ